jgi:hypothetical protein
VLIKINHINHEKLKEFSKTFPNDYELFLVEKKAIHETFQIDGKSATLHMGFEFTYRVDNIKKFMLLLLANSISYTEV